MSFHYIDKDIFDDLETVYSECDDENCELLQSDEVENDCTDSDLYEFYFTVLQGLLDAKRRRNVRLFRLYCKLMRQSLDKSFKLDKNTHDLMYSYFYYPYYLYRNGPVISSAVARLFEKAADLDSNILDGLLEKSEVSICSFGGFPADVVGIVHKLCYAAEKKGIDLNVRVAIIDFDEEWKNTCISTLMYLKPFRGCISRITFYLHFQDNKDILKILKTADIICLTMFFSKSIKRKIGLKIMQNVCELSKSGCMILVFDYPKEFIVEHYVGYSGKSLHKYCIPICDNVFGLHTLKGSVLQKHSQLYNYLCNNLRPINHMKYLVRIWLKSKFTLPSNKELDFKSNKRDLELWFENNKLNPILKNFHLQIEGLKLESENMKKRIQKLTERIDFLKLENNFFQDRLSRKESELRWSRQPIKSQIPLSDCSVANKKMIRKRIRKSHSNIIESYEKAITNAQCAEIRYLTAEEELNKQKTLEQSFQVDFDAVKDDIFKRAWKTFRDNKRELVHSELCDYRQSITRSFK